MDQGASTEDIEMKLLTEGIFHRYGYDFRDYAEASFKRRLRAILAKTGIGSLSLLQHEIMHSSSFFAEVLSDLTVTVSDMFRDPTFFKALRQHVFPILRTYPTFKVWHAGCSTGEEVYSLAIALREEALLSRAVIYATDINTVALKVARDGIYSNEAVQSFTANYYAAGGTNTFADYFTSSYGSVRIDQSLRENVVFSEHNLVTDEVFSETNLILSRNVLIYFKRELQDRALNLFSRSLAYKGFLCLGSKETVRFMQGGDQYRPLIREEAIFQRIPATRTSEEVLR